MSKSQDTSEEKKGLHPVTKMMLPILGAALVSVLGTGAGLIAKHEGDIRTANRKLERSNVDKYRRTLEHLRVHFRTSGECVVRNKRILRGLPEGNPLIPVAESNIDQCEEEKSEWKERIENYVEENKHMGYDD